MSNGGTTRRRLKTYPALRGEDFMHPWDVKATHALRRVPGLDRLIAKILELGFEKMQYLQNVADNVRVTETMFPSLHRYLGWGCKILELDEPELYVSFSPEANAYTYGHTRPFIVLSSELLEILDEQERFFVIAHELGHIKCEHVLYTIVAENIKDLLDVVGRATLGVGALVGGGLALPLYDWHRKAELSADRAALLCVQDVDVAVHTFMKLAGGARSLVSEMDKGEFLRQIRSYEEADESVLNRTFKFLITATRTHPFPILRAKHLDAWVREGGFDAVGSGR